MERQRPSDLRMARRSLLKIVAVAGIAGSSWSLWNGLKSPGNHMVRRSRPLMGTTLNLTVIGPDRDTAENGVDRTIEHMLHLETLFSRFRSDSFLSRLNSTGVLENAPREFLELLALSQRISIAGEGAFDVSVLPLQTLHQKSLISGIPADRKAIEEILDIVDYRNISVQGTTVTLGIPGMAITFDGIGKGFIVDKGVEVLKTHGFDNVFVEAGGDLMAAGSKAVDLPWRIGLQNPRPERRRPMTILEIRNRAVASSGDYMQFYLPDKTLHHIVNPHTGFSPPELAACTITAPNVALADGLATAAMVLGREKSLDLLSRFPGCEGYFVDKNMNTFNTNGFFG